MQAPPVEKSARSGTARPPEPPAPTLADPSNTPPAPPPHPRINRGSSTKGGGRAKLEAAFGAAGVGGGVCREFLFKSRGRKLAVIVARASQHLPWLLSGRALGDRRGEGPPLRAQSQPGHHGAQLPSKNSYSGHPLSLFARGWRTRGSIPKLHPVPLSLLPWASSGQECRRTCRLTGPPTPNPKPAAPPSPTLPGSWELVDLSLELGACLLGNQGASRQRRGALGLKLRALKRAEWGRGFGKFGLLAKSSGF